MMCVQRDAWVPYPLAGSRIPWNRLQTTAALHWTRGCRRGWIIYHYVVCFLQLDELIVQGEVDFAEGSAINCLSF